MYLVAFPWSVGNKRVCAIGGGKRHVNDDVSAPRVINRCLTLIAILMSIIQEKPRKEAEANRCFVMPLTYLITILRILKHVNTFSAS